MKKRLFAIALALIFTPSAYADKPDWAGKGKPNIEEIKNSKDKQKALSDLEEREQQLELLLDEKKKAKKNAKSNKDKKKIEKEIAELEDTQEEVKVLKAEVKNKKTGKENNNPKDDSSQMADDEDIDGTSPTGVEKQRQKKEGQERKEQGKGSEKGQEQREEKSKKWWKFWE